MWWVKNIALIAALPFFLFGAAVPPSVEAAELRALTAWPSGHPVNAVYHKFLKALQQRSGGELEVRLVGGPEVVAVRDGLKAAGRGTVDILFGDPHYYGGELPITQVLGYVRSGEGVAALAQPGAREFLQRVSREDANVIFLGFQYEQPFYIQTAKRPAIRPEDFKGLKLRSPGGLYAEVLKATGAVPVRIASPETYEALQRGVVDGAMRNTLSLRHFKEYEIIRYIMVPAFIAARTMVVMNASAWERLPAKLRKVVQDTAIDYDRETVDYWYNKDKEDMKWLRGQGVIETVKMSPEAVQILGKARIHAVDKLAEQLGPERGRKLREFFEPFVR